MENKEIYLKALKMLENREEYYGNKAHKANISHIVQQCALSEASAYHSAWCILYYAIHDNWEALAQFDYFGNGED